MKKLFTLFTVIFSYVNISSGQVVVYDIPASGLVGMQINSGDFCFNPGEYKQSAIGNTWGFTWTSTNSNMPSSVTAEVIFTINDGIGPHPSTFNGMADAPVSPSSANCGIATDTYTLNPANYNPMGVNTFLMNYSSSSQQNQIMPSPSCINCYVRVTVDYSCTLPDVSVTNTAPTLTANQNGASYQWLDCDNNYAIIPSETNQNFTATVSGNYAVQVNLNGCIDTSACENVMTTGLKEDQELSGIDIFPNPTNGIIYINKGHNDVINYSISTIEGRIIEEKQNIFTNELTIDLNKESKGIYFLKIDNGISNKVVKIIKQ